MNSNRLTAAHDLLAFIDAAPSPFHACAEAARRLDAAGFTGLDESAAWPAAGRHYIVRGGTLVAWAAPPAARAGTPFSIVGAHTDSPNLRIKPQPDIGGFGWSQLGVETYGGALFNSWLDRDLGLSGRVSMRSVEGPPATRLLLVDRPVLRVPQLAIHLDRDVNTAGLTLNPQVHLNPVWALGGPDPDGFRHFLAKELDVDAADILAWDVMVHDVVPGAVAGRDGEFVSSGRIDNLCSCWAAVDALAAAPDTEAAVPVIALFDHEEVGSATDRGAGSPVLATVLERISLAGGGDRESFHRAMAGSVCVSADMAHATHPNYPERHDLAHVVTLNGGPVLKTNVNERYASDAPGTAVFLDACERAGVPVQRYVHRNDLPCGSTIGPITASRLGITTVDIGAAQLAMHSARELMGADDADYLRRALGAFLTPA
jgi:aspartyl aminopeptidase